NTVALNDTTLAVGDSLVVHAAGYDADGNYRTDESVSWSLTGNNIGTIATGPSIKATFHATQVGVGYIKADHSNPAVTDDLAGPITVGVGDTSYVLIRTAPGGSGQVVGARTLTADDSLILYAAAYDNANNYLGAARVIWAVTNSGWNSRISKTDTSIVFSPVMAPDSGKIIANHYSAKDDTTGMIVVKPGKPFGNITLIPTPTTIPADGLSKSTITSNVIRDAENNPVAENTQFTARTTLGTLVTPNASGTSVPVFANASGKITFELQASSVGGIAHIYVTSVGGSATGDTSVAISNLKIVSVYTEKTTVSRGQTGVPVSMTVENLGTVTIDIDDADLTFTGSANRDAEYTVHKPSSFPSIPGNQSRSWSFSVDVNPAASTEVITIDGTVSGKVNGVTVSDNSAETKDSWLVQTPAQLKIIRVETTVDTVYQGQRNVPVSMIVKNEGQATALLTSNTLTFWSIKSGMDVTANYEVSSLPGNPSSIAGSGQATLQLRVHVATGATVDSIRIDGQVGGKDANSEVTISDVGAETIDYWFVRKKPLIAIDSFEPSSPEVTKGQEKDWYLTMTVINRGSTPAILDPNKTKLTFRIGGQDVTSQYTIIRPSVFLKSKTDTLRAPTPPDTAYTDTLRFIIDKTGGATGPCNIQGTLYVTDAHTGEPFENHAYTGITVQEPANLTIVQITPSQSEVTRGQEKDWYVKVPLKNSGASSVTIDTSLT
ncbi:MAG: Ig-like domain-containing protein, partial [candidate division KSB1 bacterium]|nr:Ig-like domain-containing protein [candidate division KSB1 bacterium]